MHRDKQLCVGVMLVLVCCIHHISAQRLVTGAPGEVGATGPVGAPGLPGNQGVKGAEGDIGAPGPKVCINITSDPVQFLLRAPLVARAVPKRSRLCQQPL